MNESKPSGISLDHRETCDWLRMRMGKANAMGPEFLEALEQRLASLTPVENSAPARPLIVTGEGSAFSAGLDLAVLLDFDRSRMDEFVTRFNRTLLTLASLSRPTIAAVNGHAIAGGAVMLLGCDYRIGATHLDRSTRPYWIGLRESQLGLPLPRVGELLVSHALAHLSARLEVALTGDLFAPARALHLGLLDRLVPPQALELEAERLALRFSRCPASTSRRLKLHLKQALYLALEAPFDNTVFLDEWFSTEAQRRMKEVVARLRR